MDDQSGGRRATDSHRTRRVRIGDMSAWLTKRSGELIRQQCTTDDGAQCHC